MDADYDIVLLPSPDLARRAVEASSRLAAAGTYFVLGPDCLPHLSLYMLRLDAAGLAEVRALMEAEAATLAPLAPAPSGYHAAGSYFEMGYERTDELAALQRRMIEACNRWRTGLTVPARFSLAKAEGMAKENLERYGYKFVGELFRPHITLTRFLEPQNDPEKGLPEPVAFSGAFDRLALCPIDENGSCIRVACQYWLPG